MPEADRTRLAARLPAEYLGFGYAPLMPADLISVANIAGDLSSASLGATADGTAIAAIRAQTLADRRAVAAATHGAAGIVTATVDRAVGRRLNDTGIWSVVRATPFWSFGPDGALVEMAADELSWNFDTNGLPLGTAHAGQRINVEANSRTPGRTGWTNNGLSSAVSAAGPNGVLGDATTITESLASTVHETLSGNAVITSGLPYSVSVFAYPGACINVQGLGRAAAFGSNAWANFQLSGAGAVGSIGSAVTRSSVVRYGDWYWCTYTAPATASGSLPLVSLMMGQSLTDGRGPFYAGTGRDVTFGPVWIEQAEFASLPILPPISTPGASTRAQGLVSVPVPLLGARFNRRQGVLVIEWNSQPGPFTSASDTDAFGLISLGDTTANEVMGAVLNPAHNLIEFRRVVGGVALPAASVAITPPAAGVSTRCAIAWDADAGLMQIAARGTAGTLLTAQTSIPAITHVMPGRFSTTRPHFGGLRLAEIRPLAAFGATLAAMT